MAASWKKIIVSGSVAELDRVIANSFTGSYKGDGSGLTGVASSLNIAGNTGTGTVNLTSQTLTVNGTANEVETSVSNQTITVGLPNNVTISNTLTATTGSFSNLIVTGATTVLDTTNLRIEDRFVLLASGSTTGDGGIIKAVATQGGAQKGYAFFYDGDQDRWSFADDVLETNTGAVTPLGWASVTYQGAVEGAPVSAPPYGGTSYGHGSFFIDTVTGDAYIYVKDGATASSTDQNGWGVDALA